MSAAAAAAATLESAVGVVWRASWQAGVLAGVVLLVQWILGKRLGAGARYLLWSVVVVRLLLPVSPPQSRFSLFNLLRAFDPVARQTEWPTDLRGARRQVGVSDRLNAEPQAAGAPFPGVPAPRARLSPVVVFGIAWLLGAVLVANRVVICSARLSRQSRRLARVTTPALLQLVESCAAQIGLRRRRIPAVVAGETVATPAVAGVLRPVLMLPSRVLERCDHAELRLVVMHELAHLKRHDVEANWLLTAATVVHWFNPIVWLIAARVRADRELACDELVLSRSRPSEAGAYGRTLLKLIEILSLPPSSASASRQLVGILESSNPMKRRVRMIAKFDHRRCQARWLWTSAALLALGCTALTDSVRGGEPNAVKPFGATAGAGAADAQKLAAREGAPAVGQARDEGDVLAALDTVVAEVNFDNIAFADVVEFLRQLSGQNIVTNWRALEAAGIDRNTPVTLKLRRAKLGEVLDRVLGDVGGGNVRLAYTVDRSALLISTQEDLSQSVTTRFYDVSDLIVDPAGQPLAGEKFDGKARELSMIIQDAVAMGTWKDHGGNVGSMSRFNGKLIVVQTAKAHQEIEQLLAKLRENPRRAPTTAQAAR